jgi:hypothetical protein
MISKKDKRQATTKGIIIIPIIICALVIIFLVITVFSKGKATEQEIQPVENKRNVEPEPQSRDNTPAEKTGDENQATAKSQTEIEKIKMDIITGKREDVPDDLNMSSRAIIRDFLYKCSITEELNKKLECFELYYLNNDANLMQQKKGCEALGGDEKTKCLDKYYFMMGGTERAYFCEAITDTELRNECLSTAV